MSSKSPSKKKDLPSTARRRYTSKSTKSPVSKKRSKSGTVLSASRKKARLKSDTNKPCEVGDENQSKRKDDGKHQETPNLTEADKEIIELYGPDNATEPKKDETQTPPENSSSETVSSGASDSARTRPVTRNERTIAVSVIAAARLPTNTIPTPTPTTTATANRQLANTTRPYSPTRIGLLADIQDERVRRILNTMGYRGNVNTAIDSVFIGLGLLKYKDIFINKGYRVRHIGLLEAEQMEKEFGMSPPEILTLTDFIACIRVRLKIYLRTNPAPLSLAGKP